ncbi:hypothetical protein ABFS83_12G094200 [Erythranthe nasuta]
MESLIKQTRSRFAGGTGQDNKEERSSTTTFKEKKRNPSWIRRQLSRQMSWDNDSSSADYPTAIAAAAYAIQSLEQSQTPNKNEMKYGTDSKSLNKIKSKAEDKQALPEPLKSALRSSDGTSRKSFDDSDKKLPISTSTSTKIPEKQPSVKKKISFADMDEIAGASNKPEKSAVEKAPSVKRPPAFADKQLKITEIKKPDITLQKPDRAIPRDPRADAWEKEEMASIKERYEKMRATVDNWETKKKKKAKRKIEKIEAELDKRRAKAVQSYKVKIARIEGIAGGARVQAEKNRKNEESKAKDKANKIRLTGMLPATCLCF